MKPNGLAAVIQCESNDYMVVDLKKRGMVAMGDQVDTLGLWFGETGALQNKTSGREIEVTVQCVVLNEAAARHECDDMPA